MKISFKTILSAALLFLSSAELYSQWELKFFMASGGEKLAVKRRLNVSPRVFVAAIGIFYSDDYGSTWTPSSSDIRLPVSAIEISDQEIYAGTAYGLYSSTDEGQTWNKKTNGLSAKNVTSVKKVMDELYVIADSSVYKSCDNGNSWVKCDDGFNNRTVSILFEINNDIYAISHKPETVHKYNRSLSKWEICSVGFTNNYILSAYFDAGMLFIGTWGGPGPIYYSTDFGKTWKITNQSSLAGARCFQTVDGIIVAGGDPGGISPPLQYYNVVSESWHPISSNLPPWQIMDIAQLDGKVFVVNTGGVLAADKSAILNSTGGINTASWCDHYDLYPTVASETITFDIGNTTSQDILISITNIEGRSLMTHHVRSNAMKSINFSINVRDLAVGKYYAVIASRDGIKIKQFLINRY